MNEVTLARRRADADSSQSVLATLIKLLAKSAYGSLLMNKERHTDITYVEGVKRARILVNNRFRGLNELHSEIFQIEMAKKTISLDLPTHLSYFILQYAKLRILQFYYDCVDTYLERSNFCSIEMDTDSLYLTLNARSFRDAVKHSMKATYDRALLAFCYDNEIEGNGVVHWFARTCCPHHTAIDLRTPGLFKVEFEGTEMIALSPKTYIVTSLLRNETKYSSKGVNKTDIFPLSKLKAALFDKKTGYAINRGMRPFNITIYSYHQNKSAFSYLYCKRIVLDDGFSTKPLDLMLEPCIR